jgi:CubicO group peptidase (beta-lactamase class C family)
MRMVEHGRLGLDDPVARHIPEFAQNGKEHVTVRHLLTHTAGLRAAARNINGRPWEEVIAEICAAPMEPRWVLGETAGYHGASTWFLLGELLQRLAETPFIQCVREKVFQPLGMEDSWIGMPPEQFHAYGNRIVPIFDTSGGAMEQDDFNNTEMGVTLPRPGSNGRGPIRELGRFYEMLRGHGSIHDARILSADAVRSMTTRHRAGLHDRTFNHRIDFGLGFILNSAEYGEETVPYGYGPYASGETFGHSGSQSSCAFCDSARGLVVAWCCNGMPGEPAHQRRQRCIHAAIYEDLRLV